MSAIKFGGVVLFSLLFLLLSESLVFGLRGAGQEQPANPPGRQKTIEVGGEQVVIVRDDFGVPHIFAQSLRGLFFGNGYAVAEDRLWQMERYRRTARGELAELEGEGAVEHDIEVRRLGYTEGERQAKFEALGSETRIIFTAYAEGANAYIREAIASRRLPEEFVKRGIEPRPWLVTDSIAIGDMMADRFGSWGGGEIRNLRILNKLKKRLGERAALEVFSDLFWQNDPRSPTTISGERSPAGSRGGARRSAILVPALAFFNSADDALLARAEARSLERAILEAAAKYNLPARFGSYAWLLAPSRTASGSAILVGGPQMGFSTPQIAHEVHLSGAGFNVIGMGFAGLPGVLIGHNEHLAWTSTSGLTDMVDIFAERLNPQNRYQYFHQGRYRDMEKRVETVRVRGGRERRIEIYRTVHGPVVEWDDENHIAYARASSFRGKEHFSIEAFLGFNRARTIEEFARLASLIWSSHNMFCATVTGDIGFWHAGRPPLRASGADVRLPLPGTGEYDWPGSLSFEKLPQVVNPPEGYIVNWNNKPAPWWDNGDRPTWGEIFRIHRIVQLIRARDILTFEQARDIAFDIAYHDQNADYLKPYILKAVESAAGSTAARERIRQAAAYLRAWDNRVTDGSVAKAIFDAWLDAVRDKIFLDDLGDLDDKRLFNQLCQPSLILRVFQGRDAALPLARDYLNGKKRDQVILEALEEALARLAEKHGPQMNFWGYKLGEINLKPLPPIPAANRGTYIQIVELSRPVIRGANILPPGQSEDRRSPHYSDQRELAAWWGYKPMRYLREQLKW